MLGFIPSPSVNGFSIGPISLHMYGFLIVAGVFAAVWLADRRWRARGGEAGTFSAIAVWAVPGGLIGARLYHVATDYELYTHHPLDAFKIWQGGLGIWGGIAGGVLAGWLYIRRHDLDFPAILDTVAPALPLAQAIGRWGNYFNQELFGRPTTLPWGLKIDLANRPAAYAHYATFHPTFLYESLWDLAVVGLVLVIEKRVRLRKGYLFGVYVALYTFGRFFTEYLRIDFAHRILGLRVNDWVSVIICLTASALVLRKGVIRDAGVGGAVVAGGEGEVAGGELVPVAVMAPQPAEAATSGRDSDGDAAGPALPGVTPPGDAEVTGYASSLADPVVGEGSPPSEPAPPLVGEGAPALEPAPPADADAASPIPAEPAPPADAAAASPIPADPTPLDVEPAPPAEAMSPPPVATPLEESEPPPAPPANPASATAEPPPTGEAAHPPPEAEAKAEPEDRDPSPPD